MKKRAADRGSLFYDDRFFESITVTAKKEIDKEMKKKKGSDPRLLPF